MTRPFTLTCLTLAILSLAPSRAHTQIFYTPIFYPHISGPRPFQPPSAPVHYPIEIGEYVTVGGASTSAPTIRG